MPLRPYWNPYVAGALLGLALLLTYAVTGHGLGASGFFGRLSAGFSNLRGWITWEVLGLVIGALLASTASGRFRLRIERGWGRKAPDRLVWALAGGLLVGFGARVAQGCTSGLGLSGGAVFAPAAFVFLAGFFAAGFALGHVARRFWP